MSSAQQQTINAIHAYAAQIQALLAQLGLPKLQCPYAAHSKALLPAIPALPTQPVLGALGPLLTPALPAVNPILGVALGGLSGVTGAVNSTPVGSVLGAVAPVVDSIGLPVTPITLDPLTVDGALIAPLLRSAQAPQLATLQQLQSQAALLQQLQSQVAALAQAVQALPVNSLLSAPESKAAVAEIAAQYDAAPAQ